MDVTPLVHEGLQIIQSYTNDGFKVSSQNFAGAVIVSPNRTEEWHVPDNISDINTDHVQKIVDQKEDIDVLLVGTGKSMSFLPPDVKQFLEQHEVYPDMMDTGAACRTFNVLVAEGRRVTALLFKNA